MHALHSALGFFLANHAVIASAFAIMLGLASILRWGHTWWRKAWHFASRYKPTVPRESVRLIPSPRGHIWISGSANGQPVMFLTGYWFATNVLDENVLLLAAYLRSTDTNGGILVQSPQQNIYGSYPIPPHCTSPIIANFAIQPPLKKPGKDFKATVAIVDQFGNEHVNKNVVFKFVDAAGIAKKLEEPEKPSEAIHEIKDPIEKDVASVLKAEVTRYRQCGRSVGGLGSIVTQYGGRIDTGLGTEWRTPNSPSNQSLVPVPQPSCVKSENAGALVESYRRLPSDDDRERFKKALLARLVKDSEYTSVAYLILLVSHRLGLLGQILPVARQRLAGDSSYGFSEFLRLLDGLLRFEYPTFSQKDLDEIERFLDGLKEHSFQIRERIHAINAKRIAEKADGHKGTGSYP